MTEILQPRPGESIYDPHLRQRRHAHLLHCPPQTARRGMAQCSRLRTGDQPVILRHRTHEPIPARRRGLRNCKTTTRCDAQPSSRRESCRTFDMVLANPPYSIKQWTARHLGDPTAATSSAPRRRGGPTMPSYSTSSRAWTEGRKVRHSSSPWRTLPQRGIGDARKAREKRSLEAVIGLGANLFFNSPMEPASSSAAARKRRIEARKYCS